MTIHFSALRIIRRECSLKPGAISNFEVGNCVFCRCTGLFIWNILEMTYHCYHCHASGDLWKYFADSRGMNPNEALEFVAKFKS
jgi:hypothetical protein